jgi:hypothetical protein
MVINETHMDLTCQINLSGFQPTAGGEACSNRQACPAAIVSLPEVTVSASGFQTPFPAYSITMVEIPEGRALA